MKQPRFVSWAAVSSLPQAKKISVDDQLATNQEHVARWGGMLYKELPIRGKSRFIANWEHACATIPEYAQLREMIAKREFDVLIYLDRSRLGRKRILIDTIVDLCEEAGIITYATESPPSSLDVERNFAHKVVGAIESILAQEEVHKIQRRHEMGMAARVRNGNFPGRIPFGWTLRYEVDGDRPVQIIEVDEEAQRTIHTILDMYLRHGASSRIISEHLKEQGIEPPRDNQWTRSIVDWVVNMVWRYAGYQELNRKSKKRPYLRAQSKWPALIDEELAKAVEKERKRRGHAKRSVGSVHLFSQMVFCKRCEHKMHARYNLRPSRRDPAIMRRTEEYRCYDDGIATHKKNQISAVYILDMVKKAILFVQNEANRAEILATQTNDTPQLQAQLERANARLAKLDEDLQRADDAYVLGKMSIERYQRQVDKLDEARSNIEEDISRLTDEIEAQHFDSQRPSRLDELASEGLVWLESDDIPTANAWFRAHLRIWIDNDNPDARIIVEYL